jgi:hypothetical protein
MAVLWVYFRLYGACLRKTGQGLLKNPWTALLPMAGLWLLALLAVLLSPLGIIGGFLAALAFDAVASCYLYFLGEVVVGSQARMRDLKASIGAYFWSVVNVGFVVYIAGLLLGTLMRGPQAQTALIALKLTAVILLNAVPEVIYQRGTYGGIATIREAAEFLQASWLEWLLPNLLLGGALYALDAYFPWGGTLGSILNAILLGAAAHALMVFRGHLFAELVGSSHRQRMFKYRTS